MVMTKKWIIVLAVILIVLGGAVMMGPVMSNVEHPAYNVISSAENIEIRHYDPMIIAEVTVQGEQTEAIGNGFRLLADYIFGNNTAQQSIAMTAPVQQQTTQQQKNEKIAMTAPVQQQASGDSWTVSFVMPSNYSMETLPKPKNDAVNLKKIPSRHYAVIRFSGKNTDRNVFRHEQWLMEYIKDNQIQAKGTPKYAFYNPPWTLPFLRRNEVMIEIEPQK